MTNYNIFLKQLPGLFVLVLLLSSLQVSAQSNKAKTTEENNFCGFEMSQGDWTAYKATAKAHRALQANNQESNPPILYTPVIFHIVRNAAGDGLTIDQVNQALAWANEKFAPANIRFFQCAPPNIVISDTWFNRRFCFSNTEGDCAPSRDWEEQFDDINEVANVINIYCLNTDGSSWYRGGGTDYVVLNQGHANSQWILAHELGHYSGLPHTFSGMDENVTRNPANSCYNCETAGDGFCDTPADRHDGRSGRPGWNPGCVPEFATDDCGALLQPDGLNIMSYSNNACPAADKYFSPEQRDRMYYVIGTVRDYLNCGSDCVATYDLSGTHHNSRTYRVWNTIQSTAGMDNDVSITYQAENYIRLEPGFRAVAGARETFIAIIANCVDNLSGPASNEQRTSESGEDGMSQTSQFAVAPNPFSGSTIISYTLSEPRQISLQVFNATGVLVANLLPPETQEAGEYRYTFEAKDLPVGLYLIVLQKNGDRLTKRVALAR